MDGPLWRQLAQYRRAVGGRGVRPSVDESLCLEMWRSVRYDRPLSVLMLTAALNRAEDRPEAEFARDAVFETIDAFAEAAARFIDHFGRLGGAEYLFVLPETDEAGAEAFAKRFAHETAKSSEVVAALAAAGAQLNGVRLGWVAMEAYESPEALLARARAAPAVELDPTAVLAGRVRSLAPALEAL